MQMLGIHMPKRGQKKCANCGDYEHVSMMTRTEKGLLCSECALKPVSQIDGLEPMEMSDEVRDLF